MLMELAAQKATNHTDISCTTPAGKNIDYFIFPRYCIKQRPLQPDRARSTHEPGQDAVNVDSAWHFFVFRPVCNRTNSQIFTKHINLSVTHLKHANLQASYQLIGILIKEGMKSPNVYTRLGINAGKSKHHSVAMILSVYEHTSDLLSHGNIGR